MEVYIWWTQPHDWIGVERLAVHVNLMLHVLCTEKCVMVINNVSFIVHDCGENTQCLFKGNADHVKDAVNTPFEVSNIVVVPP